jgi:UDP-N-acetylglucosamine--N-acetylmuramyl-(pentapeptide) pyrophosphoryl-undecaprenol N-acetylglucosamine transferase
MKILFTGGGTGGHFYPIIAVAERVNELADREKLSGVKLYYMSNEEYDKKALFENGITFVMVPAGKLRIYPSIKNFFDMFKTAGGILTAIVKMFVIYPDVIFSKGAYASFPALMAARILRIPVVIHESDSAPGRVNKWAGKFAKRIAISFPEALEYFPKEHTAWTGQPIRKELLQPAKEGPYEFFKLQKGIPTIFILGGSQGSAIINDAVLEALPVLLPNYQIIHQVGRANKDDVLKRISVILDDYEYKDRYHPIDLLSPVQMKMAAGAASVVISRAGSTIFEIACWGIPSILIPFNQSNGDHAKKNAFAYARAGGCTVLQEDNISPNILLNAINDIVLNENTHEAMRNAAKKWSRPDAAETIATEILDIAKSHN